MGGLPSILGLCGAPCTGKTTLAGWLLRHLTARGVNCELLPELARLLSAVGIAIDREMRQPDYDAFLAAYQARDAAAAAALAIADRTPVDHCSYLSANRNLPPDFVTRHRTVALAALDRYRLLVYLPVQFPLCADGFRETSLEYQHALDRAIGELLAEVRVPVITVRAERKQRRRLVLQAIAEYWPELAGGGPRVLTAVG